MVLFATGVLDGELWYYLTMTLSNYHQKYASYRDEEILNRVKEKREELVLIFKQVKLNTNSEIVHIAVLGCGDKRFIEYHKEIFKEFIVQPIKIDTFDITIKHLDGGENIIKHDCTLPLPNVPFDITYGHILLKFIETEKQWNLIKNSFDALKSGGLAIHVMDKEDYETEEVLLQNGQFSVPLDRWKKQLSEMGINFKEIPIKYGLAFVLLK